MIFFFSSTGNSRLMARRLGACRGERVTDMAESLCKGRTTFSIADNEHVGFVMPVYGWDIPPVARRFVETLTLENYKEQYTYLIVTCGDDTGRTWCQFGRLLRRKHWHLDFGRAIIMPNTYVCLPGFDTDNDSLAQEKIRQGLADLASAERQLSEEQTGFSMMHPGSHAWFKTYVLGRLFHRLLITDRLFHVTGKCTGCGRCAKTCPLHNISMEKARPRWHHNCTGCLSCYHHCPAHALRMGLFTKGKGRYCLEKFKNLTTQP